MALKDITQEILEDAQRTAEEIKKAGEKELKSIRDQKDRDILLAVEDIEKNCEAAVGHLRTQSEFQARMMEKNALLNAKREILNEVFDLVKERLGKLKEESFVKLIKIMLEKAPRIEGGLVFTSEDKRHLVARALKESGLKNVLSKESLSEDCSGFVIKSDKLEINGTIENLVENRRSDLEVEIAKILF